MKLTFDRKETKTGLIFKKTCYVSESELELSPEEMALAKKHKWNERKIGVVTYDGNFKMDRSIGSCFGKGGGTFDSIEALAHYENLLTQAAKNLKSNLEAGSGFTEGGPREVVL